MSEEIKNSHPEYYCDEYHRNVYCNCNPNCYYKQLQRKEKEYDYLKKQNSELFYKNRELINKIGIKGVEIKVNRRKIAIPLTDFVKINANEEIAARNRKIIRLKNEISSLQWKFYDNCKMAVDAKKECEELQQKLQIATEAFTTILYSMKPACYNEIDCPANGGKGFDNHCNEACPFVIAKRTLEQIGEE